MKKGALIGATVGAATVVAGYLFLVRPQPTPPEVANPVDTQYEELSIAINDLTAKAGEPDANIDSLATVLETLRWKPVKDGGKYEVEKRNLYLNAKRDAAMAMRTTIIDSGGEVTNAFLDDIEAISE